MKKLIVLFVICLSTFVKADKELLLETFDSSEESAVSIDSEEEYNKLRAKRDEPEPVVRSVNRFYDIDQPWVRSAVERDKKIGLKIARLAEEWYKTGKRSVVINKKQTNIYNDCSHFVRAVYWHVAGIDLMWESVTSGAAKRIGVNMRSGCALIYAYLKSEERTSRREPRIGDIIFFDNTWDKNRNRRWDDPLTHVGLVINYTNDGTVTFIHANTGRPKRIRKARLNLRYPADRRKNTYLKVKYRWDKNPKLLAGQITRGFGGFSFVSSKFKKSDHDKNGPDFKKNNSNGKDRDHKKKFTDKHSGSSIIGTWKLFWKRRNGRYSYIFKERILEFKDGGRGRYKTGGPSMDTTWKKQGNAVKVLVNGDVVEKFTIKSISGNEMLVVSRDGAGKRVELMFHRK